MDGATRVLVVEDEALVARSFGRVLRRAGYEVTLAGTLGQALAALTAPGQPAVVLLDLELADGTGEQVLDALAQAPDLAPPPESA